MKPAAKTKKWLDAAGVSREGLVYSGQVHLDLRLVILDWGFQLGAYNYRGDAPTVQVQVYHLLDLPQTPWQHLLAHPRHLGSTPIVQLHPPDSQLDVATTLGQFLDYLHCPLSEASSLSAVALSLSLSSCSV